MRPPNLIVISGALLLSAAAAFGTITINFGADKLFQSNGTTPIPAGSLLQLVASTTDNVFTSPTPTSFVGGSPDDLVVASFSSGSNGSFAGPIMLTLSGNLTAGDFLMLRWWPTLTTGSITPGIGTSFGQFRTDAVENFSNTGWFVPADGSTISLNFLDTAGFGSEPNSAGTANFTTSAVPEPGTWVASVLTSACLGLVALRRRIRA